MQAEEAMRQKEAIETSPDWWLERQEEEKWRKPAAPSQLPRPILTFPSDPERTQEGEDLPCTMCHPEQRSGSSPLPCCPCLHVCKVGPGAAKCLPRAEGLPT